MLMAITNTELAAKLACKSNTLFEKQQKLKAMLELVKQKQDRVSKAEVGKILG